MENEKLLVDAKAVAWLYKRMDEIRAEIYKSCNDELFLVGLEDGIRTALYVLDLPREVKT